MRIGYLFLFLAVFSEIIYAILHKPAGESGIDGYLGGAIVEAAAMLLGVVVCVSRWGFNGEAPSYTAWGIIFCAAVGVAAFGIDSFTMISYQHKFPLFVVATLVVAAIPVSSTLVDYFYYNVKISACDWALISIITAASSVLSWGK